MIAVFVSQLGGLIEMVSPKYAMDFVEKTRQSQKELKMFSQIENVENSKKKITT